jgi:hypothetical protein
MTILPGCSNKFASMGRIIFFLLASATFVLQSCQPQARFRIRTFDAQTRELDLLWIKDSTLILSTVNDTIGRKKQIVTMQLSSINALWHKASKRTFHGFIGAIIGYSVTGGVLALVQYGLYPIGIVLAPLGAYVGATIASNLPTDGTLLLPQDPETITFLEDHAKYYDEKDLPEEVMQAFK